MNSECRIRIRIIIRISEYKTCICGFDCIYTVQLVVCPLMFPLQNGEGKLRAPKLLGAQSYFESKDTRGPELPGGS